MYLLPPTSFCSGQEALREVPGYAWASPTTGIVDSGPAYPALHYVVLLKRKEMAVTPSTSNCLCLIRFACSDEHANRIRHRPQSPKGRLLSDSQRSILGALVIAKSRYELQSSTRNGVRTWPGKYSCNSDIQIQCRWPRKQPCHDSTYTKSSVIVVYLLRAPSTPTRLDGHQGLYPWRSIWSSHWCSSIYFIYLFSK